MNGWVRIDSWHREREGDQTTTRCGLVVRAHPSEGEHQATAWRPVTDPPPRDEPTCETCLRDVAEDQGDAEEALHSSGNEDSPTGAVSPDEL